MLLKSIDVGISLETLKHAFVFSLQTVNHDQGRVLLGDLALDWLSRLHVGQGFFLFLNLSFAQVLGLYSGGLGRRRGYPFALQGWTFPLFEALTSGLVVGLVLLPLFALEVVFSGTKRIFARLGELSLPILAL